MEPATISALQIELRGRSKFKQNRVETIQSLIPRVYKLPNPLEIIWCPKFLTEIDANPFPSKSLKIAGLKQAPTFYVSDFSQMPVIKVMSRWNLGHSLTSFILCKGFRFSPYILKLLLQQMPNLKLLQFLDDMVMVVNDCEKDQFKLPLLSKLAVLKVTGNRFLKSKAEEGESTVLSVANNWLVDSFLGSLTLTDLEIFDDDNSNFSLTLKNFPNLKTLKLWWLERNIF